jgi:hypothetical protein
MKSPTLSKRSGPGLTWARHCRTRPLPAPTLGLTGSGSRLRAPPHDGSMTARSPSGKRRPPVSSHTAAPPLPANRRADHRSHSLDFGGEERRGETEMMLGFRGERSCRVFVLTRDARHRSSQMDGQRRFGLDLARWADEMSAQAFAPVCDFQAGWARPKLSF